MTNETKYKTAEERTKAFDKFCLAKSPDCMDCKLNSDDSCSCRFAWLTLEAEEEKGEKSNDECEEKGKQNELHVDR